MDEGVNIPRFYMNEVISAKTMELHLNVMCTSESENRHPLFFRLVSLEYFILTERRPNRSSLSTRRYG